MKTTGVLQAPLCLGHGHKDLKLKNRKLRLTESDFGQVHCCPIVEGLAHYFLVYEAISLGGVDLVIHHNNFHLKKMSGANGFLQKRENMFAFCCGRLLLSYLP